MKRTGTLFGVSIIWYLALLMYGYAYAGLSESIGEAVWAVFNALALLLSIGWGIKTGEWRNTSKKLLIFGCVILVISWSFITI